MKYTLIDAGPMIALFDGDDRFHKKSVAFMKEFRGRLISTWPVVTEVIYMLNFSVQTQTEFLEWIERGAVKLVDIQLWQLPRIREIMEKYADLPADLADATLLLAAEEEQINEILSIDRDFSGMRTTTGKYLENVFVI